jgi:flagellin
MNQLGTAVHEILTTTKFNGIDVFTTGADIKYGEDASLTVTIAAATVTAKTALKTATDAAVATPGGVTVALVEAAITENNTNRATYGAAQNKLEHVVNNLNTTGENIQASESRIRDVDMAKEMMEFTKNNILLQAAQAMLAQANSQPQGVLQLLR